MQYFTKGVGENPDEIGKKKKSKQKAITKSGEPKPQRIPAALKTNSMNSHENKLKQPVNVTDDSPDAGSSSEEDSITKDNVKDRYKGSSMEFDDNSQDKKIKRSNSKAKKGKVMADLSSIQNNDDDIINLNFVRKNVNKSEHFGKTGGLEDPGKIYGANQKKSKKSIDAGKFGGAKRDSQMDF